MAIAITDEHRQLESVVGSFLDTHKARAASRALLEADEEGLPPFWDELVAQGWLGLHLPEEHGGSGFGLRELVVVLEGLGRSIAPGPFLPTVLAAAVIADAGDGAQQARWLPDLASGERIAAVGLGGSAEIRNGKLTGDAGVVLGGARAGLLVLAAGEDLVVIDADRAGLQLERPANIDPSRRSARVHCDGVAVEDGEVLAGAAERARAFANTLLAAEAAGGARECVEMATAYAKERHQFGRPIGAFQAVKHHCADMLVAAEMATALVWDAARAASGPADQFSLAAAAATAIALPGFVDNASLNTQVHGGIGYTWEHDAHLYLRRAIALQAAGKPQAAAAEVTRLTAHGVHRDVGVSLPPEAEEVRTEIRAFAREAAALDPAEQREHLIETGYAMPHWPKPWGREASAVEQLVIDEEFAAAGVRRPQFDITGWVMLTIIQHGTQEQVERWVRPTLREEMVWCQLFSEPDAGSDAAGVTTRGVRTEGGWIVNGQKVWTSGADKAHYGLATVRTDPDAKKHAGITTMAIDMRAPGVEVRPLRQVSGDTGFNEVFFSEVFVPDEDVVGAPNDGWTVARATLGNERVSIGGGTASRGSAADTLLPLLERHGEHLPNAAQQTGRHLAEEHAMGMLNLRRAARAIAGAEPGPEGNVTKLVLAEHVLGRGAFAAQLVGPETVFAEGDGGIASHMLLTARGIAIAGGTSEIARNVIGERILGLPRDPLLK